MCGKNQLIFPEASPPGSAHFRCRGCCSPQSQSPTVTKSKLELGALSQGLLWNTVPPSASASPPTPVPAGNQATCSNSVAVIPAFTAIPLISIGTNTDSALDRLGLPDTFIPQLHKLLATVRSNMWEARLQTAEYGNLDFEQATTLSNALKADICVAKVFTQVCQYYRIKSDILM
jgi:hypothetical protein